MIKLTKVSIDRYKSFETTQTFAVDPEVTVLVGMNESGKTNILEAIAKANYFQNDDAFKFNMTHDYPRKQKKTADKAGIVPKAVTLEYEISNNLSRIIERDSHIRCTDKTVIVTTDYSGMHTINHICFNYPVKTFLERKIEEKKIDEVVDVAALSTAKNAAAFKQIASSTIDKSNTILLGKVIELSTYFQNSSGWENPVNEYFYRTYIEHNLPKFMYYDDYYALPSRISLDKISSGSAKESSDKTAKALLDLADINLKNLLSSTDYENYKAELEATQAIITDILFKYWTTNKNLRIQFDIDKVEATDPRNGTRIVDHVLDIRVQNLRSMVSLPLLNRSKGFNWFFSFLVWFKKIQADQTSTYILLLDEPGLNLHAMAQNDLLRFIDDLSANYQVIYTTHSPFMIESDKLCRVRTIVEKDEGSIISESIQEKDPNTLFPLQAALGYDIAQNLFISKKNLLVEGVADLVYITVMSSIVRNLGKESLKEDITIVPVGGADKVTSFISLMRGSKLNIVCLLDTFKDRAAQDRLSSLVVHRITKQQKIMFFHEITGSQYADIEDLFSKDDFLKIYNGAFETTISIADLDLSKPVVGQLSEITKKKTFNHYSPANYLAANINNITISDETTSNFCRLFQSVNKQF